MSGCSRKWSFSNGMSVANGAVLAPFPALDLRFSYSYLLEAIITFLINLRWLFSSYMNVAPSSYSSVSLQLKELTQNYLTLHPGLTLNALALRSGIAATTLRRIMQEENRSELAPHTVLP